MHSVTHHCSICQPTCTAFAIGGRWIMICDLLGSDSRLWLSSEAVSERTAWRLSRSHVGTTVAVVVLFSWPTKIHWPRHGLCPFLKRHLSRISYSPPLPLRSVLQATFGFDLPFIKSAYGRPRKGYKNTPSRLPPLSSIFPFSLPSAWSFPFYTDLRVCAHFHPSVHISFSRYLKPCLLSNHL
jgi:hypothetical protein